ncbi:ALP1-like protein isoform X1 [Tanacetum coccineum]
MDPNNPNIFDTTNTYDHYDVYFQSDYDRYMRDYEAYHHFVALCEQEAGGSRSGLTRRRTCIPREREDAEQRLIDDYFGDNEFLPKYPEENFRRRYRMSSTLFNKIVNNILSYDVEPIPEYFTYFRQRYDATGRNNIGLILKCTSVIRQPARAYQINMLKRIMYYYIILHNMILDDEGFEVNMRDLYVSPELNIQRSWVERCELYLRKSKELRDRKMHNDLRQDLVEHL